jgi:Flp pilus assembly protein TadD
MKSGKTTISRRKKRGGLIDTFISHASQDEDFAVRLGKSLEAEGLSVWLDHANIRGGGLLVPELMQALQGARNIVVLWSEYSSKSQWVSTEWTSVVNLNHQKGTSVEKGVTPCLLDKTPLAIFLLNYVFCDFQISYDTGLQHLLRALKKIVDTPAPAPYNPPDFVEKIYSGQKAVLASLSAGNLAQAKELQGQINSVVDAARRQNPNDLYILNLAGYHKKNEYMIRHWKEFQAGKAPKDALLDEAMQTFFMALSIEPEDPSALNGIGNVFILRRDLDAAEFYVGRALERSKQEHLSYEAAEHDLELIKRLKTMGEAKG